MAFVELRKVLFGSELRGMRRHVDNVTHCDTLQNTAIHCNKLQHNAKHCNTLQHTAAHCNIPQRTATHYNTLQRTAHNCCVSWVYFGMLDCRSIWSVFRHIYTWEIQHTSVNISWLCASSVYAWTALIRHEYTYTLILYSSSLCT